MTGTTGTCYHKGPGQIVTRTKCHPDKKSHGQNVIRTKSHRTKCHPDKMSPRPKVAGQNVTRTKCHRTKCHWTKCYPDKMSQDKLSHGQNVSRTKCHTDKMSPGQNVTRTNLCVLKGEEFLTSNYTVNYHIVRNINLKPYA